mmetsp:Transcript_88458/g.166737  ORF Transcript_88458/g.166737 Transcript_88458/m.166737 type:complete len:205 (+) Transcript_88458:543-1157(+)
MHSAVASQGFAQDLKAYHRNMNPRKRTRYSIILLTFLLFSMIVLSFTRPGLNSALIVVPVQSHAAGASQSSISPWSFSPNNVKVGSLQSKDSKTTLESPIPVDTDVGGDWSWLAPPRPRVHLLKRPPDGAGAGAGLVVAERSKVERSSSLNFFNFPLPVRTALGTPGLSSSCVILLAMLKELTLAEEDHTVPVLGSEASQGALG